MASFYTRPRYSIDRDDIWGNVSDRESRTPAPAPAPGDEPAGGRGSDGWKLRRRAQPANFLLPLTRRWLNELPVDARPFALARHYPRLANQFAAAWGDTDALAALFDGLMVDRRGGRRGLPEPVMGDVLALWRHRNSAIRSGRASPR